jgi:hypothetical protein
MQSPPCKREADEHAFRPIALTAMKTLEWYYSDALTDEERANPPMMITAEREAEVLAAWKERGLYGGQRGGGPAQFWTEPL